MTREDAIALAATRFWVEMSPRDIATFQLFEEKLCMPFEVFHKAVEQTLGRPVYTHEFGLNPDGLKRELTGDCPPPTLEQIIALIPEDKRIIVVTDRVLEEGGDAVSD